MYTSNLTSDYFDSWGTVENYFTKKYPAMKDNTLDCKSVSEQQFVEKIMLLTGISEDEFWSEVYIARMNFHETSISLSCF